MRLKILGACLLGASLSIPPLAFAAAPADASAAVISPATEAQVIKELLAAMQTRDYDKFVGLGNENFAKLEKPQFDAVVQQIGSRLQNGYHAERLTAFQQQGYEFTLWKITFKDNGDDLIGTLNITRDGKVGGFVLR